MVLMSTLILLAPLYRLMANWSHRPGVVISHRSHGRDLGQGSTFMESMGNYAINFPVGITLGSSAIWQEIIQEISDRFQSLPMNGVTYDWIGDRLPEYLYPDSNLTPIRVNYLGNRSVPPSNLFEFIQTVRDCRLSLPIKNVPHSLNFSF